MNWQAMGEQLAPILTGAFCLGIIAAVAFLIQMRRRARSTSFGYVREQSENRGKRLVILLAMLGVLAAASGAWWGVSARKPGLLPTPAPTATLTLVPSPTPRDPTPTFTPTGTPTITPTPTRTPVPPDADLPGALRTPFPDQAVEPDSEAALVDLYLALDEQGNRPAGSETRFPSGTERVYAFLTFDYMARDVPWVHAWYALADGELVEVWSSVELWSYDDPMGYVWRYLNCEDGSYELHIYIGRQLQQRIPFTVGQD